MTSARRCMVAALLVSGCMLRPVFAYDSATLAEALESLTPASFATWEKKAHAGDALAQNVVGMAYKYGEVTPQNHARSLEWFLKAANRGDADAQFNLGRIYGKATGPVYGKQRAATRDDVAAASWYRKAAEQNYAPAQFNLAQMYAEGSSTFAQNLAEAYFWLQLAGAGGDPNALKELNKIEGQLSATEKRRADLLIASWKQRHTQ
jgi:TPR repeat protein